MFRGKLYEQVLMEILSLRLLCWLNFSFLCLLFFLSRRKKMVEDSHPHTRIMWWLCTFQATITDDAWLLLSKAIIQGKTSALAGWTNVHANHSSSITHSWGKHVAVCLCNFESLLMKSLSEFVIFAEVVSAMLWSLCCVCLCDVNDHHGAHDR